MKQYKNTPKNIIKQFNRPQFKIGDYVYFTWLGSKQQGYVKKITTQNWGVQYLVVADEYGKTYKYPCGIDIKGYKTSYHIGCILREETKKFLKDKRRPIDEIRNDNKSWNRNVNNNSSKSTTSRHDARKNVNESGSTRICSSSATKRQNNTELKNAIQKQKDFLNGFVKKD
tara:strand:- start:1412 stop:1924 length:513 start_codon:yes stop_codon:yes gene_type:complete